MKSSHTKRKPKYTKRKPRNKYIHLIGTWFFMTVLFILIYYILDGSITSLVIYHQTEHTQLWDFTDSAEYTYDESLIVLNSMASLLPETEIITIEDYDYENSYITQAVYDSKDKTSQIRSIGSGHITADKDKIFNVIFENELNNNDVISIYIKESKENDIYLCDYNTSCNSPGYGLVHYDGNEGWYNLTILGLDDSTDRFNIDPEHVKFDYLFAYKLVNNSYTIENTTYPHLATIETQEFIIGDFYKWGDIKIGEDLNSYSINYYYSTDSGANWNLINNFNLTSVNSPRLMLRADLISDGTGTPVLNSLELKYLTNMACEEDWSCAEWNPEECPENKIQTRTCADSNECGSEDQKPETTGSCEYCAENWLVNYMDCVINDTKLKYYSDGNNCGTTNNIPADNNTYVGCDYCTPIWNCVNYGTCHLGDNKYCNAVIDNNSCYEQTSLDSDQYSGDYSEFAITCSYDNNPPEISNIMITPTKGVVGIIVNISLSIDDETNITLAQAIVSDSNNIIKKLPLYNNNRYATTWNTTNTTKGTYLIGINVSDINSNNAYFKQIAVIALDGSAMGTFTNYSVILTKGQTIVLNTKETTDTIIEITSKDNLTTSISTTQYSENLKNKTPAKATLVKYLDITVDDTTNNNIAHAKMFIYYNGSEINNANIDENTLRIHYYNETIEDWQTLNSSINTTADYIWAELPHFSTYGVFGEQKTTSQQSSSEGGGGEGSQKDYQKTSKLHSIIKNEENDKEKPKIIIEPEKIQERDICTYSISLELPEKISFVDTDTIKGNIINSGDCDLDRIEVSINWETIPILSIEDENIGGIKVGEKKEISLKKNSLVGSNPPLIGFTVKFMKEELQNYNFELITNGIANNTIVVQTNLPINVKVLAPSEETTLKPSVIFSLAIVVFLIITIKKISTKKR